MRKLGATVVAAGLLLAGCSSSDAGAADGTGARTLTVLAAASLTDSFTALEATFEAEHPGVDVKISFAGSSALVQQITNGAPADVFASADEKNMKKVTDAGLAAGTPVVFATNELAIAVPPDNPAGIASFADLANDGVVVVVCAPQVPCGAATEKIEQATGSTITPVSEEQDVKSVLNKVRTGEADAGLVYVTDVNSAGDKVKGIAFPESQAAVNAYPITVLEDAPQADLAKEFVDLVTSETGKAELEKVGFVVP
ncbi:molybdate ABC transporter substrate-binding protein [Actinophytocola sp. NPDC049390]|uniref:molybdate ABC transporter substrate-binding protein n=1 Tax=Actinophytocola sp. NPDC049390 TaxID=3363894 RepID=UPI0037BC0227